MINEIFAIDNFNIISDDDNYYFFRALNKKDMADIENKVIVDENGKIVRIRTDREFYGETTFKKDEPLTLEQIIEHIKMDYNRHTNCISFSSNANVCLTYGRGFYDDKYIMLKVPKKEMGKSIVFSGEFILEEITKALDDYYKNLNDEMTRYFFDAINNANTKEQLNNIKAMLSKDYVDETKNIFVNGLEKIMSSQSSNALNSEQNLLKDKIILKMDLMKEPILKKISNKFLINTLGGAFSSLELTHYNDVQSNITELSPEIMDILSLLQQGQKTKELANLKRILIQKINAGNLPKTSFNLEKYDTKKFASKLTLENIFKLTGGNISYKEAKNIYLKSYILAKSRLRKEKSLDLLKSIVSDPKYDNIIEDLRKSTYGIEPEIVNRQSNRDAINLSESVNLLVSKNESDILEFINDLSIEKITSLLENPFTELPYYIVNNNTREYMSETWMANSIIDLIDWSSYGVLENLSLSQRNLLINAMKSHDFMTIYNNLNKQGLSNEAIANAIMLILIRNTTNLDIKEKFSLSELEEFLGCNQIKDTKLVLKPYQREAFTEINHKYHEKDYTACIMPTGTGKSYVSIAEMHYFEEKISELSENKHAKMLYLAPNNYILDQLKRIIAENYRTNFTEKDEDIVKRVFPGLTLTTYSYLSQGTYASNIINADYDFIVLDELHRTGASEWGKQLNILLDNQTHAKVLGMTATPERDMDGKDMSEIFAKKYGYTDDEILEEKHLAFNMDLLEAIESEITHNPKVVNCEYSLLKDGSLDELELKIDDIMDENLKLEKRKEYEALRREIESSSGIEQILRENLKSDGKYIVFIPITQNKKGEYVNTETYEQMTDSQAQRMIKSYQNLMAQFLFAGEYLEKNKDILRVIYNKINNNLELDVSEITYLNNEKDNILLLTKLHIKNRPNALQSLTNDMAHKIIDYMRWEVLVDSKITSIINKKMKHKIESYSMLSDNNKIQNNKNLANFNSSESPKLKLMFVMDMLNEGVHVNKIDGIIWFRALNEDSRILFLQQLGRSISAINENNKDNIPIIIDLVNNTLKVNVKKGVDKEKNDLSKLIKIAKWIEKNGFPDPSKHDEMTMKYYKTLKRIESNYSKYLNDETLESQKVEKKVIIEKILEIGSNFDLWNYEFIKYNNNTNIDRDDNKEEKDDLLSIFNIRGRLRLFSDFYKDVKNLTNTDIENVLKEIVKYLREHYPQDKIIRYRPISDKLESTGGVIGNYLGHHKQKIIEKALEENEDAKYICKQFGWLNDETKIVKEIADYLHTHYKPDKIIGYTTISAKLVSTGGKISNHLHKNKQEIIEMALEENEDAKYICKQFGWLNDEAKIVKEIADYLRKHYKPDKIIGYTTISAKLVSTGGKISNHLHKNKQEIIEMALEENEDAKYICKQFGWLNKEAKIMKEIAKYLRMHYEPDEIISYTTISDKLESIGAEIGKYLSKNKQEIIEMALKENEDVSYICKRLGWLTKPPTPEEKIKDIADYLHEHYPQDKIISYRTISAKLESIGGKISNHLQKNKKEIIEMALEENEDAKYICKQFGWLNKEAIIVKEIADYLHEHYEPDTKISYTTISAKLESIDGKINNYLSVHKQEIIEMALNKNEDAISICTRLGWSTKPATKPATPEEKIKKIADYLHEHYSQGEIKSYHTISDKLESTGGAIGNYLSHNKQKIIEMALHKNEDAISICNHIPTFKKDLYKRMDEIASNDSHFQKVKESIENKMEVKIAK